MRRGKTRTLGGMNASALEAEVLSRIAEDYEAAHTIAGDIARDLRRPIPEAEVLKALLSLARGGLAQAYVYDSKAQRYRAISASEAQQEKQPWFMSTRARHAT
jgi:hypothetical protein